MRCWGIIITAFYACVVIVLLMPASSFALLGVAMCLAIPIAAWQARAFCADRLSRFKFALAYVFSTVAMIALVIAVIRCSDSGITFLQWEHFAEIAVAGSCCIVAIANIALVLLNCRHRIAPEAVARVFLVAATGLFLLAAYFPLAISCLAYLNSRAEIVSVRLQLGALAIAVACLAYLITVVLGLRSEKRRRAGAACNEPEVT